MSDPRIQDSEQAREMGKASGRSRRQKLNLARVEQELGALDSLEDAQRWLWRLCIWGAAGLLAGSVLGGCVRAVDQWIRAHESRLTRDVVDSLRKRLEELEGQARARGVGR